LSKTEELIIAEATHCDNSLSNQQNPVIGITRLNVKKVNILNLKKPFSSSNLVTKIT
jgi:hypothetical protein